MSGKGASGQDGHGKPRKYPGIKGRRPDRKAIRRHQAAERMAAKAREAT